MFSAAQAWFLVSSMKLMNWKAASLFSEAFITTIVSTHRSDPSFGITYLMSLLSVMP